MVFADDPNWKSAEPDLPKQWEKWDISIAKQ